MIAAIYTLFRDLLELKLKKAQDGAFDLVDWGPKDQFNRISHS